jgi:hypothetical protein
MRDGKPRRQAVRYIRGVATATAQKNGWQTTENVGGSNRNGVPKLDA